MSDAPATRPRPRPKKAESAPPAESAPKSPDSVPKKATGGQKRPRKQNRPRIDAICNAIAKGEYDGEDLLKIQGAITDRLSHKRAEVEALVKQVYGDGFVIAPQPVPNPIPVQGQGGYPPAFSPPALPGPPSPPAEEIGGVRVKSPFADDDSDIESRSPIITGGPPA